MSSDTSTITTVEDFRDSDGQGPIFRNRPDFHHPVNAAQAEFIYKASAALTAFRKQWIAEHQDDSWAKGLEIDIAPVHTDGMIMGYMVVSEIDGETYDYVPTKAVEENP